MTRILGLATIVLGVATLGSTAQARASEPTPVIAAPRPEAEPLPGAPWTPPSTRARVRATVDEGFGLDSADGRFGLSLGFLGQLRYAVDARDGDVDQGFSLRLARPMLQGHLWGDRVVWQLQTELAGGARLLDANAIVHVHPALEILVGQYRPWFTRGFSIILPILTQLDRGAVLDAFRIDRDVGVTVMGRPFDGRLEYYVGVLDGEGVGERTAPRHIQPLLTARLVAAPLGGVGYTQTTAARADENLPFRFAVAANAATNEVNRTGTITDPMTGMQSPTLVPDLRTVTVGGDVALEGWRMMATGEGFWRRSWEPSGLREEAWGVYGLVSGVLVRRRLELVTRVGVLNVENDEVTHLPVEPGLNVYVVGDHAKLQVRYRCDVNADSGECISQGADLQAQLWF